MEHKYAEDAKAFKVFSDENRLRILEMLYSGEKCACVLLEELEITQPTLSHHMKILEESGLITVRKDGKWSNYSIRQEKMKQFNDRLGDYTRINI
ncbi:MAG TPA: metalloregulator ArsR/SmtB family transcription factor [Anaerovoracaceae bacterium]|nr:metalloregulator ArsR/SmtB family transcription factor [Anaerovoracaceae bacterium]